MKALLQIIVSPLIEKKVCWQHAWVVTFNPLPPTVPCGARLAKISISKIIIEKILWA